MGKKKCGKCGLSGHNRRTCGKTVLPSQSPARQRKSVTPPHPRATVVNTIDGLWNETRNIDSPTQTDETEVMQQWSADELVTWWKMSTPGRVGKNRQGWSKEDTDALMNILTPITQNSSVTAKEARKFLQNFGVEAKSMIATHPRLPALFLVVLSYDSSPAVKERIAARPDTPPAVLAHLGQDRHADVVINVAKNVNTSEESLTSLFDRREQYVTGQTFFSESFLMDQLLKNAKLPQRCVNEVSATQKVDTLSLVLKHPNCPRSVLERTWRESLAPDVSNINPNQARANMCDIVQNPNCPPQFLEDKIDELPYSCDMWANPSLTESFAERLWEKRERELLFPVFSHIANNPHLPKTIYRKVLDDSYFPARYKPIVTKYYFAAS